MSTRSTTLTREQAAAGIERLVDRIDHTRRRRTPVEAPPERTRAYVLLELACGLARLGLRDRAAAQADRALTTLRPLEDPLHQLAVDGYLLCMRRAVEGLPPDWSARVALARRRAALDPFEVYKIDRLRQRSRALEPMGQALDPVLAFRRRGDEVERELTRLALCAEPDDALDGLLALLDEAMLPCHVGWREVAIRAAVLLASHAGRAPDAVLAILADAALDERPGDLHLAAMIARLARAIEHRPLLEELAAQVHWSIGRAPAAGTGQAAAACALALMDLDDDSRAARLVEQAREAAPTSGDGALVEHAELAVARAALGQVEPARRVLWRGLDALGDPRLLLTDRLDLVRPLARLCSWIPGHEAAAGLDQLAGQLWNLSDSFNTNSHYCVTVIELVDALVEGWAGEPLAIRPGRMAPVRRESWEEGTRHALVRGARQALLELIERQGRGDAWRDGARAWLDGDGEHEWHEDHEQLDRLIASARDLGEVVERVRDWLAPDAPDCPVGRDELLGNRDSQYALDFLAGAAEARRLVERHRREGLATVILELGRPAPGE